MGPPAPAPSPTQEESYAPGESGPRRSTPYHATDASAANAEAARLARELGISSSSERSTPNQHPRRSWFSSRPRSSLNQPQQPDSSSHHHHAASSSMNRNSSSSRSSNISAAAAASTSYVRMADVPSVPLDMDGPAAAAAYHHHNSSRLSSSSIPAPSISDAKQQQPHLYDAHGQRAPYKEGPYYVSRARDGRVLRQRWYGRIEDGYIAWSSIYLHEYFGFTIYMPLTLEEEMELKKPDATDVHVPRWMYEFTSLPNLAIFMSYFCIGVALQLLRTPLIVYFIEDLGATPAEVNVLFTVMAVPWCFKMLYGFLSDCVPIQGRRRKPYFVTGWIIYIACNLVLMITPIPSIQLTIMMVFLQTTGYMLSDVMTDALIVERSRFETQETRGAMQSTGYVIRFFGSTIGATIGAVVYNKDGWDWYLPIRLVFFINAAFPVVFLLPFVPFLLELDTNCSPKNFWKQCQDLFHTVQLRSVWEPMIFVYVYNALQLTNGAWMNFLVEGLQFTAWEIGLVSVVGSLMSWFGIMTYEKFFFASNWRIVYFWCTTLASSIALGQLVLVFGLNGKLGIPDIWFSMGDDVLVEFVIAVQFLPACIMYLSLCPAGSEGTTYAMLTTFSNLAGSLAFDISTALTTVWDVSSQTIAAGDYGGVWRLSLLCGVIGPLPLVLLGLIPKNKEDQKKLQADTVRHYWAGVAFISVMILTLMVTFIESVYEVYFNDESDDYDNQRRRLKRLLVGH